MLNVFKGIYIICRKKLIEKDTPDPGEKVGFATDGQMEFCLIHAIIKFYLENVCAYYFYNRK